MSVGNPRPFLLQTVVVAVGLGMVLAVEGTVPGGGRPWALLAAFAGLYVLVLRLVRPHTRVRPIWSRAGWGGAGLGVLLGAVIAVGPLLVHPGPSRVFAGAWRDAIALWSVAGIAATVCAVTWEELWFRSPVLNLVGGERTRVAFVVFNGVLFAALHLFNPAVRFALQGPELFAAGAFLTAAYFASGSIHFPLGLHLGNNVAGGVAGRAIVHGEPAADATHTLVRAAVLVVAAVALLLVARRRSV